MNSFHFDFTSNRLPNDFQSISFLPSFSLPKTKRQKGIDQSKDPIKSQSSSKNLLHKPEPSNKTQFFSEWRLNSHYIEGRSHSSMVQINNEIYIYGGYGSPGALNDFYKITFEPIYKWIPLQIQGLNPGRLYLHGSVFYKDKIWVFGGKKSNGINSNEIHYYDIKYKLWFHLYFTNNEEKPNPIDSFSLNLDLEHKRMVLFGGFNDQYSNEVYFFNFESKNWTKSKKSSRKPSKRASHSGIILNLKLWIFGGADSETRFSDLWSFDLENEIWKQYESYNEVRIYHTMVGFEQNLIVFGGSTSLTHEKNDILVYNVEKDYWRTIKLEIEFDSDFIKLPKQYTNSKLTSSKTIKSKTLLPFLPHSTTKSNGSLMSLSRNSFRVDSIQKIDENIEQDNDRKKIAKTQLKKREYSQFKSNSFSKPEKASLENEKGSLESKYSRFIKKKEEILNTFQTKLAKKMTFLSQFDLKEDFLKNQLIMVTPTTEVMKYAIEIFRSKKRDDEKNILKKKILNLQKSKPFKTTFGKIKGNFPCPRDGHMSLVDINAQKMFILGGDRHKVQFNDVYECDLKQLLFD